MATASDLLDNIKRRRTEIEKTWYLRLLMYFGLVFGILEIVILYIYFLNVRFSNETFLQIHADMWVIIRNTRTWNKMIVFSVPIILTAIGAAFNERAGVINIGLEGIMLFGAFGAAYFTFRFGDPFYGVIGAIIFGIIVGFVHAIATITFKSEQIVTGVAINLAALGLTKILTNLIWDQEIFTDVKKFDAVNFYDKSRFPGIAHVLGKIRFRELGIDYFPDPIEAFNGESPLLYFAILLIPLCHILLFKTSIGLRLRTIGEHPQAAATAGVPVHKYQYFAVILSSVLASIGGAMLSLDTASFDPDMVGGKGFYALAVMIFGKWTVIGAAFSGLFFGFFNVIVIPLQIQKGDIPREFIQMLPNIFALLALAGFIGRARPPKAIGQAYDPDEGSE